MKPPQLNELQHFAKLGRYSAHLLHEIVNPLTAVILNLEQCKSDFPALRRARRDVHLIWRYVEAARQQICLEGKSVKFYVNPQLEQLKRIIMPMAKSAGVTVLIEPIPHCRLYGDPVKFQQLAANLIVNAIDAYWEEIPSGRLKTVRVVMSVTERQLTVRVMDWGKGITAEQLEHLFTPFYTTKQHSQGLGIGLSIVREYVTIDFQGTVTASSSLRRGTQLTVKLPLPTN